MANEQFVVIPHAPGYTIDVAGVVVGKRGLVLKHQLTQGRWTVRLHVGKRGAKHGTTNYVHRLIADAFLAKPTGWTPAWKVVFLDHNPMNLDVANLAWRTNSEANLHKRRA